MLDITPDHNKTDSPPVAKDAEDFDDSYETSRTSIAASGLLESQLHEIQEKLAKFEKQTDLERLERERLEHRLISEPRAITITDNFDPIYEDNVDALSRLNRRLRKRGLEDLGCDEEPAGTYMSKVIWTLESELERLRAEKNKVQYLFEDLKRLRSMENDWNIEQNKLPKKQIELGHLSGNLAPKEPSGTNQELDNAEEQPLSPIHAKLNRLEWTEFQARSPGAFKSEERFVVEVLIGEPVVSFKRPEGWQLQRLGGLKPSLVRPEETPKLRKPTSKLKQFSVQGQAPLPERIRINSKYIMKILEVIHENPLSVDDTVVMIRPYKSLEYYNEPIRQKFSELREKFEPQVYGKGEVSVKTSKNAGEEELTTCLTAYEHLKCLIEFMDDNIRRKMEYLDSNSCQTVFFSDIWYLFKPGDEVIEQKRRQAYRVLRVTSSSHRAFPPWRMTWGKGEDEKAAEETPVLLHCACIDFDGKQLGPITKKVRIARFDGEKAITSLEVFPLRFAETRDTEESRNSTFRKKLVHRGRIFLDMTSFKHMHYNGLTLDTREEVDSHVVVDFEESFSARGGSNWRPDLKNLITQDQEEGNNEYSCDADCCKHDNVHQDSYAETQRNKAYIGLLVPEDGQREPSPAIYPRNLQDVKAYEDTLPEEDLLIMPYRVFGFILRTRKWAHLELNHISPPRTFTSENPSSHKTQTVDTTKEGKSPKRLETDNGPGNPPNMIQEPQGAFDQLVLPKGHKEIVVSLIAQHFRDKRSLSKDSKDTQQVDFIRGKGNGLIILLHGAPGVGKTTTAEGVAEMFRKPLFQITCGDLGTTAPQVEEALERHFTLANRWGCVLLLDEADVFLAARSKEDFIRNGLVTVFLRVLEYYDGILFLTTNRIGDFDEALYYPQLDLASTKAIFELNLNMINNRFKSNGRLIIIENEKIHAFAEEYFFKHDAERWNGRQIRNACQTALALAEFRAQGGSHKRIENQNAVVELKVEDLQIVSTAYLQFMQYLNEVRGKDVDRWAKGLRIRARELDFLLNKEDERAKGKERAKESQDRTVPATFTHLGGPRYGIPQVISQASPSAPMGPPSGSQYAPGFNPTHPNYFGAPYYGQGTAAPHLIPPGITQPPPSGTQPPPDMSGWPQEAITAWFRQRATEQQASPQVPPAFEPHVSPRPLNTQSHPNMSGWPAEAIAAYFQQHAARQ